MTLKYLIAHLSIVNVAREAAQNQKLDNFIRFERGWHSGPLGDFLGLGLKQSIPIIGLSVLNGIRKQGIDLAFIDGDHSSSCTLADFLLLKDYLNINGIAVFHDVFHGQLMHKQFSFSGMIFITT